MGSMEHLDEIDKVIQTITAMTDYSSEEVMTWKLQDMMRVYKGVENVLADIQDAFYPVFEFQGTLFGFQPLSKMSVGEYADLERRLEDPIGNLEEIMAILYRKITKENFHDFPWKVKSYIRHLQGKPEQLFKLYDVEEYDSELRDLRAEIFKELPIEYALGSLRFFFALQSSLIKRYSNLWPTTRDTGEEDESDGDRTGSERTSIGKHYGYLFIFRNLDISKILAITGDRRITDVNYIFMLNWMSMEMEIQAEEKRERQRQEMMRGQR